MGFNHYLNLFLSFYLVNECELICLNLFVLYTSSVATISVDLHSIPILNGSYFKDWKENIFIALDCIDLDFALWIEHPTTPTNSSSYVDIMNHEK